MADIKFNEMTKYYKKLYEKHGISHKSLGWHKGNQFLRFFQLTKEWNLDNSSILDVGCGFGDFNTYLKKNNVKNYHYLGIDINDNFIKESKKRYSENHIKFIKGDFLKTNLNMKFDYTIASGTFNYKIKGIDCYDYIHKIMKKMYKITEKAFSIDFLSNKVDYAHTHNFNYDPIKILNISYCFSKKIILNNSVFPFEFNIVVYVDDSFEKEATVFNNIN